MMLLRHAAILTCLCCLPAVSMDLFDPEVYPTGPVASVTLEEYGLSSTDPISSTTTQLDKTGRAVVIVTRNPNERRTTFTYRDKLLVSTEWTWTSAGKPSPPVGWRRWTYDSQGRLQRFQMGQGTTVNNDYSNFVYDSMDRLTSSGVCSRSAW